MQQSSSIWGQGEFTQHLVFLSVSGGSISHVGRGTHLHKVKLKLKQSWGWSLGCQTAAVTAELEPDMAVVQSL